MHFIYFKLGTCALAVVAQRFAFAAQAGVWAPCTHRAWCPGWAKVWVQACITTVSARALGKARGKHRRANVLALLWHACIPTQLHARQAPARKRPSFARGMRVLQQFCTRARPGGTHHAMPFYRPSLCSRTWYSTDRANDRRIGLARTH